MESELPSLFDRRHVPAIVVGTVGSLVHLWWWPPNHDLASHTFRIGLFERAPTAVWNNFWFAGHHTPAYSLVVPLLGSVVGVAAVGVGAVVLSSWMGSVLAHRAAAGSTSLRRPVASGVLISLGCLASLTLGRTAFVAGIAFGLVAVVAATGPGRWAVMWAASWAAIAAVTSPVAGAFVALIGGALILARWGRGRAWWCGIALVMGAMVPLAALVAWFPEGGDFPFPWGGLANVLLVTATVAWFGRGHSTLWWACVLYAGVSVLCAMVASPMGGNVARLAALAAPAALVMVWPSANVFRAWWPLPVALALALMLANQWAQVDALIGLRSDQTKADFYQPLVDVLALQDGPLRVEVVPVSSHGEAEWVPAQVPIARGWNRQLDRLLNPILFADHLTADQFLAWLQDKGVSFVALADTALDEGGTQEAALLVHPPAYLREIHRDAVWRVWAVEPRPSLTAGPGDLTAAGVDWFDVRVHQTGDVVVKIHFSPWFEVTEGTGCVRASPDGWTTVHAGPGPLRVEATLSWRAVVDRNGDC